VSVDVEKEDVNGKLEGNETEEVEEERRTHSEIAQANPKPS
jgi:hypothetical protein